MLGMDLTNMTLNDELDEWLVLARTRVTPTTYRSYVYRCRTYLRPKLGDCLVGELTIPQLNSHFIWLLHHGGPLKHTMVAAIHIVLRKALADAVRTGRLADNVAARLTLPRHNPDGDLEPDTLHTWDAAQAARFLELTANDPLHGVWRLALATGMRRGEVLGLRWEDVEVSVPQIRVLKGLSYADGAFRLGTTKTGRGRVIAIDQATADILARQPPPTDPDWPLVFTRPNGKPWRPVHVTQLWCYQWPELDLPRIRLHDLRHCHACLLLDQGVPVKVVSERLGHRSIAKTLNTYAHVLPAQDREAAQAIQRAMRGQRRRPDPTP